MFTLETILLLSYAIAYIKSPGNDLYAVNIFPKNNLFYKTYVFLYFIAIMFCTGLAYSTLFILFLIISLNLILMRSMLINEIRIGSKHLMKNNCRSFEKLPIVYRTMEIQCKLVNGVIGPFLLPCQIITCQGLIFGYYAVIAHNEGLDRMTIGTISIAVVLVTILWGRFLHLGGIPHSQSKKTVESWKNGVWGNIQKTKYIKKFAKGCKPFAIEFAGYFKITKMTLIKYLTIIIKGVLRALLASKGTYSYKVVFK
jgi:hypothetical protein